MITSTPNTSSSTSRGTATQTLTRSATMVDEMKPRAPPASRTGAALGKRGMPLLMWISPSRPIRAQLQPTTWRPAGPLLSGCRRVRQAINRASSGSATPSVPKTVVTPMWIQ